jgi:type IV fimbrial biogenesis protein FimT
MLKNQEAFTLIELLITLLVLAILASLAVPSFRVQVLNSKAKALEEDLTGRINQARYEAIKKSKRVSICASSDGSTCTGGWTDGYIVFEDNATTDGATNPIVGTILRTYAKPDLKTVIEVKNNTTAVTFMRFTPMGTLARISGSTNPHLGINAYVTGCKGKNRRVFTLGVSGLISVKREDCPA